MLIESQFPQTSIGQTELSSVKETLVQATIKRIQQISQNHQEALQNYPTDNKYLQKNIWYPDGLAKACLAKKQPNMVAFIKDKHRSLIGYLNPKFFDHIPEKVGVLNSRRWHFLAKPNVLPSDALKAALVGLSIIDCGMACQMARYGALLDVLGEAKFNRLFGKEVGQLMNIGLWNYDHLQPMRYFVDFSKASQKKLSGVKGNRPVEAGQIIGFEGVNNYSAKYPYGSWKASNTICIQDTPGDQKFVSLGTGPAGKTEAEICQTLLEKYNQKEDPFLLAPEDDEMAKQLKMFATLGGDELQDSIREKLFPPAREVIGFNCESSEGFIIEVIRDLIQLPLEQVSMDFVKTHPMNINRFKDL